MTADVTNDLAEIEAAQAACRDAIVKARAHEALQREELARFRAALVAPSAAELAHIAAVEARLTVTAARVEAEAAKADADERHLDALRAQPPLVT